MRTGEVLQQKAGIKDRSKDTECEAVLALADLARVVGGVGEGAR